MADRLTRFNIYWANLDPTIGHEIRKTRPVVIVSPDEINRRLGMVLAASLTSTLRPYLFRRVTDEQWAVLEPLLSREPSSTRGRPPVHDDRSVLNGILWVLRTGAAWADLPERFPSSSTCYRRFSKWVKSGVFRKILEALARDLEERGAITLCFIDGTFRRAHGFRSPS
jgi:transposase